MSSAKSVGLLAATALAALLIAAPSSAQSSSHCDLIVQMLETAGMSYTRTGADGHCAEVEAPGGGTRRIFKPDEVLELIASGPDPIQPADGNWRRETRVTNIHCPGAEALHTAIVAQIQGNDRILNMLMGSNDGGVTVPYRFRSTFNASLLLGPMISAISRTGIGTPPLQYTRVGRNIFQASGQLTQPSSFTIAYTVELGIISEDLILGWWIGKHGDCSAEGTFNWWRESS